MTTTNSDTTVSYKVCKITAKVPDSLSKGFCLTGDGNLSKIKSGVLTKGIYEVVEIKESQNFADLLVSLDHTNALTYGIPKTLKTTGVVSSRKAANPGEVTRTRDDFKLIDGPSILQLDIDDKTKSFEEVEEHLRECIEGYDDAPVVLASSASTHIYNGEDEVIGEGGKRIYIFIANGKDIPRAGKVIGQRLKLKGLFWYDISKSASLLERTMIDMMSLQKVHPEI